VLQDWKERLLLQALARLPANAISRTVGRLAGLPLPTGLLRFVIRTFARAVGVDWSEVRDPVSSFRSLQDFFTRALVDGVRPVDPADHALVAPCDGAWGAAGKVEAGRILQVKGRPYSVGALLGDDGEAKAFEGGSFATLYLSPRDYHRFHVPFDCHVVRAVHLPGTLWPVNRIGVEGVDALFAQNERICMWLEPVARPGTQFCVVAVGATMVGKVHCVFDPSLTTNIPGTGRSERNYMPAPRLAKGQELGRFEFGSTLVVLASPTLGRLHEREPGTALRLGARIGFLRVGAPAGESSDAE
jgi:phosphatidylserine decarboxylase